MPVSLPEKLENAPELHISVSGDLGDHVIDTSVGI
jgi:hypothetical protein